MRQDVIQLDGADKIMCLEKGLEQQVHSSRSMNAMRTTLILSDLMTSRPAVDLLVHLSHKKFSKQCPRNSSTEFMMLLLIKAVTVSRHCFCFLLYICFKNTTQGQCRDKIAWARSVD